MAFSTPLSFPNAATIGLTAALGMAMQTPAAEAQQPNPPTYLVSVGTPVRTQGNVRLNFDYSVFATSVRVYECPSLPTLEIQPTTGRYALSLDHCRPSQPPAPTADQITAFLGSEHFTHRVVRGSPLIRIGDSLKLPDEQTMPPPWQLSPFMQGGSVFIVGSVGAYYCSSPPKFTPIGTQRAEWHQRLYPLSTSRYEMADCIREAHILDRLKAQQTQRDTLTGEQQRVQQLTEQDTKNKAQIEQQTRTTEDLQRRLGNAERDLAAGNQRIQRLLSEATEHQKEREKEDLNHKILEGGITSLLLVVLAGKQLSKLRNEKKT